MRALRLGAFVSWLIVAGLAVGGFAAFSPKAPAESSSTTTPAQVATGRGVSTARIIASAFATAAADRSFLTAATSTRATFAVEPDSTIPEVTSPALRALTFHPRPPPTPRRRTLPPGRPVAPARRPGTDRVLRAKPQPTGRRSILPSSPQRCMMSLSTRLCALPASIREQ